MACANGAVNGCGMVELSLDGYQFFTAVAQLGTEGLLMLELWAAFFGECGHPFLLIGGREQAVEQAAL